MTDPLLDTTAANDGMDRLARDIGIPPCPAILTRFSAEMREPEPDMRKLGALIATDIALSAALLKLVNSPYYSLRTKAGNPQQALSVIGLRAAANLLTGLILRQTFPSGNNPLMQRFWDTSATTVSVALSIAPQIKGINLDEAHTYALFRDCGMPVMISKFADYDRILDRLEHMPGAGIIAAENMDYRYSHSRVGYALACGWLLPEAFCRAILYHHDFDKLSAGRREVEPANRKLVAFGLLIDQIATFRAGGTLCPDWDSGEKFVLEALAITPDDIIALAQNA